MSKLELLGNLPGIAPVGTKTGATSGNGGSVSPGAAIPPPSGGGRKKTRVEKLKLMLDIDQRNLELHAKRLARKGGRKNREMAEELLANQLVLREVMEAPIAESDLADDQLNGFSINLPKIVQGAGKIVTSTASKVATVGAKVVGNVNPVNIASKVATAVAPNSPVTAAITSAASKIKTAANNVADKVAEVDAKQGERLLSALVKSGPALLYHFIQDGDAVLASAPRVAQKRAKQVAFVSKAAKATGLPVSTVLKHIENSVLNELDATPVNAIKALRGVNGLGVDPVSITAAIVAGAGAIAAVATTIPAVVGAFDKDDAPSADDFPTSLPPDAVNDPYDELDEDDDASSDNTMLYAGGAAAVLLLGGGIAYAMSKNSNK